MTTFFVSLVLLVLGALFTWWLNQERFDVRYTISEKIPLSFGGEKEEAVQQIEIQNLGKKTVQNVQILLPGRVAVYEVFKYSQADSVREYRSKETLELVYPDLPPEGLFRVVFKAPGSGVNRDEIAVKHSKGSAQYAFGAPSKGVSLVSISTNVLLLFYIVMAIIWIRSTAEISLKTDASYKADAILRRSKPFYVSDETWLEIRKIAGLNLVSKSASDYDSDIENSEPYRRLTSAKPDYVSDDEWEFMKGAATEKILIMLGRQAVQEFSPDRILALIKIRKPSNIAQTKWAEIQNTLQERYLTRRLDRWSMNVLSMLKESKPDEISSVLWIQAQNTISDRYYEDLKSNLERNDSPVEYIAKQDLSVLSPERADRLREYAYRSALRSLPPIFFVTPAKKFLATERPSWIKDNDYNSLKEAAENVIEADREFRENAILKDALGSILAGIATDDESISKLSAAQQKKIKKLDEDIRQAKQKITVAEEKIMQDLKQVSLDRSQIVKQLKIISDLFSDPVSIDRVESYDNPFAPGNFALLRKVAEILRTPPHKNN